MLKFNQRITLQTNTVQSFKGGCYTDSWNTAATFWANVANIDSAETYQSIKGQDLKSLKIVTRKRTDVDKAISRLIIDGNTVHIETVTNYRDKYTQIAGRYEDG